MRLCSVKLNHIFSFVLLIVGKKETKALWIYDGKFRLRIEILNSSATYDLEKTHNNNNHPFPL